MIPLIEFVCYMSALSAVASVPPIQQTPAPAEVAATGSKTEYGRLLEAWLDGEAGTSPPPLGRASARSMERGVLRGVAILVGKLKVDDDVEPLDNQSAVAVEIDGYLPGPINGFELGLLHAEDSERALVNIGGSNVDVDFKSDAWEMYLGARKTWVPERWLLRPYVSAGLSAVYVAARGSTSTGSVSDDALELGPYVRAGVWWQVGDSFRLGVDVRQLLFMEIDLEGDDFDTDYTGVSAYFGWSL